MTPQMPRRLLLAPCLWLAATSAAQAQDQWQGLEPARPAAPPQTSGASVSPSSSVPAPAPVVVAPATPAPPAPAPVTHVRTSSTDPEEIARLDNLQREINTQTQRLEELRNSLVQQQRAVADLQQALDEERLSAERGAGAAPGTVLPSLAQQAQAPVAQQVQPQQAQAQQPQQNAQQKQQPVGQAPESSTRPPEVAQIFDQPGVLTPAGQFVLEPSLQYGYSATDRVALVGFTIIPAILIGLIDVRQVKTTSGVGTITGRMGIGGRFELEAKVPYVYLNADTVSREIFTGSAQDRVFNANGDGMGDVEMTARYQLNRGGPDKAFYIGWLRYKSRTGKDLFEVVTDCVTRCVQNTTGTGLPLELPTGTGFEAIQPGVTWLYPSDPVVFFGTFSYLYNFERKNVSRTVLGGLTEELGDVKLGDIWGFNLGMGLALNEKASISLGYDTSFIGKTEQNGETAPGSVRITLGTMLLGGTYRFNERVSLNVALGVGVTRDTPDMTLTARVPINF
ncbi:hypothetical protein GCM10025759_16480 [Lysobacter panacisoli]|uniref:Acetate kinase n=1 Tax=Lysobacter panacisoli TaxID=1255263 RepID=A0ABP9LA64_9GAMM